MVQLGQTSVVGEQDIGSGTPDQESSGQRRTSVQSETQPTEATALSDEHEVSLDDRDPKDNDAASSSERKDMPKTGKDNVLEFSGSTPMREHDRRVRVFEAATGIDESYRTQKLMERLTRAAWLATESLDIHELKHPIGVERLLSLLWQELEPLEFCGSVEPRGFLQELPPEPKTGTHSLRHGVSRSFEEARGDWCED